MEISPKCQVAWISRGSLLAGQSHCDGVRRVCASVAVSDVDAHALDVVADELRAKGAEAIAIPADMSDATSVSQAINRLIQLFGQGNWVLSHNPKRTFAM